MKIYLIKERNSYGKDTVIATATSKKKVLEWLKSLNLYGIARRRSDNAQYDIERVLTKANITSYAFSTKGNSEYYVIDEYKSI